MTIREQFRVMRRELLEHGDGEVLRELVDQLTAPTYGECPTRPTFLARGGRRVSTWRDFQKDALFLFLGAGGFQAAKWGPGLDAILREEMTEIAPPFEPFRFLKPEIAAAEFGDPDRPFKLRVPFMGGFDWRGTYPRPIAVH
jgi:hypothetical protein